MPQPKPRPKKLNERKRRYQHSKLNSQKYWSYLQHTVRVLNRLKGNPKQQTILRITISLFAENCQQVHST